jgi:hypothetical protein
MRPGGLGCEIAGHQVRRTRNGRYSQSRQDMGRGLPVDKSLRTSADERPTRTIDWYSYRREGRHHDCRTDIVIRFLKLGNSYLLDLSEGALALLCLFRVLFSPNLDDIGRLGPHAEFEGNGSVLSTKPASKILPIRYNIQFPLPLRMIII